MTFSPQQNRIFVLAIGLLALAGVLIYNSRLDSAKADGASTAKTECVANTNAALLKSTQDVLATLKQQLKDANAAVATLQMQKQATEDRNQELKEEIAYVTENWLAPGTQKPRPLPACVFTRGFVRVYNQSITASFSANSVPEVSAAGGAQSKTEASATINSSPDLQPSNLERADILQHITSYGARCQGLESQLNALLDYLEKQGTN